MAGCRGSSSRWFFTREQLENTPTRRCGIEADKELSYRQQSANLIQDMGQRLNVSQLTINTAIVYMHRFYMHHSFVKFPRNITSSAALFLAAKVEEQPRKLEHVIKVAHACLNPQEPLLDTKSEAYLQQAQELVILETIMLQTLGFDITIDHPHTDVVKCTQLVRVWIQPVDYQTSACRALPFLPTIPLSSGLPQDLDSNVVVGSYQASKDLAQTSYFMATNSLHLTTFCLQYKPTVIACVCIHLACKWSNWEIPVSTDGKHWWEYVDPSVTLELLDELTHEFLQILEKTPHRLKKIRNWRAIQAARKPKTEGSVAENCPTGPSVTQNSVLVDPVGGTSSASFSKPSTSSVPTHAQSSATHTSESVPVGATSVPSTSYNMAPQHLEQTRADAALPGNQHSNFQQGTSGHLHSNSHHRPERNLEHAVKHEHAHKSSSKHHGHTIPPPLPAPNKMSLNTYREKHAAELAIQKRKLETLEMDVREHYANAAQALVEQQQHKKQHTQQQLHVSGNSSKMSPSKMKHAVATAEKADKHSEKDKNVSLKLRLPIPGTEKPLSKDDLKMKIKVSSSERHSSSDEGSGKSKHSSPHLNKEHKEKHKDHSSHRHHSSHKHSHSHTGGTGSSKQSTDGSAAAVIRSPVGLPGEGNSSSSRKRLHSSDASHNHHSKMSKSSKNSGSSSSSSSVKQYVSSHNSVLNLPFPPPPPVTYQVGYGQLSTLVKLDKKPVEPNGPDARQEYNPNNQNMNYKDTFDILDSLLSAQGMKM